MGVYDGHTGWCPRCGATCYGSCQVQIDRRLTELKRNLHSCESQIQLAHDNIKSWEERKAETLAKIEKIENEPKDDWPDGTYLIAEDGDPWHTKFFFKENGGWLRAGINGNSRLTWSAVLQETENLTVYQVESLKEQP